MQKLEELKCKIQDLEHSLEGGQTYSHGVVRAASWGGLASSVLLLAIVWYYAYKYMVVTVPIHNLPIVTKTLSVVRHKPLDPGGVIFSNQDKEIYKSLGQNKHQAEEIVVVPAVNTNSAEIMAVIGSLEEEEAPQIELELPQPDKPAKQMAEVAEAEVANTVRSVFEPLQLVESMPEIKEVSKKKSNPTADKIKLPLGVLKTQQEAEQKWSSLHSKFQPILDGVKHVVIRYSAANGKPVFKLVAVDLNQKQATLICQKLKGIGQDCSMR